MEKLNDYENLGGVFRNAAAFGIDAVLLDAECADPLYRRCVRVSIGHVLTVPWTRVELARRGAQRGFTLFALTPAADAVPLDEVDVARAVRAAARCRRAGPVAARGSTPPTCACASRCAPCVDSLNVATAAAIAFYAST